MLRDEINNAMKEAMKAQDKRRVSTLRMMSAAIKDRDIEARGAGKGQATDDELLGLLQKMIKQRQESLDIYQKAGRTDLATQEREEIEIISGYLPRQMSEDETKAAIAGVVKDVGASGMKDMGKVMAALKERYAGQMDFAKASALVKGMLAG
ncbi:MAG TPA: GatB/YqeY domain-containing protein [Xanthobacteraceae bacterium]|nr:GatB/YqeY domain-containing protein [Xanthobacteraceae bacterium]